MPVGPAGLCRPRRDGLPLTVLDEVADRIFHRVEARVVERERETGGRLRLPSHSLAGSRQGRPYRVYVSKTKMDDLIAGFPSSFWSRLSGTFGLTIPPVKFDVTLMERPEKQSGGPRTDRESAA